jgi:hypothetical protein
VTLRRLWLLPLGAALAAGAFLLWPGRRAPEPRTFPSDARTRPPLVLSAEDRAHAVRRARVWLKPEHRSATSLKSTPDPSKVFSASPIECRYRNEPAHGTTTKFTCVLSSGEPIKVKYGFTLEKEAEIAASRLLTRIGFLTDDMFRVPKVRCYGCPRRPFEMSWAADRLHLELSDFTASDRYVDFDDVAVERRFPARPIESGSTEGWAWYELETVVDSAGGAGVAERDALKLAAMLLVHWDNKAENQRLVCLDDDNDSTRCEQPWAMVHDLGSTFGPHKVDLDAWKAVPIWNDARACTITMHQLPYGGGTFPDAHISEQGRQLLLHELEAISEAEAREWLAAAGFDDPARFATVFLEKVRQIRDGGPC